MVLLFAPYPGNTVNEVLFQVSLVGLKLLPADADASGEHDAIATVG